MSREIKFRAWDKKNKSFIPDDNEFKEYMIGLDGKFYKMDFYSGVSGYEDGNLIWNELENIVLMEYTGLKDKNGKEIYEGDIVFSESNQYYKQDEIIWDCFGMGWDIGKKDSWKLRSPMSSKTEIIGNIYENPELITEVKNV